MQQCRCSYFEPGRAVQKHGQNHASITAYRIYKRYYTSIVDAQLKLQQENCEVFKGYSISTLTNWIHIWLIRICIDMATISFPVIYFIFETVASLGRCPCLKRCFAPTSKCTCISYRVHGLFVFCLLTSWRWNKLTWPTRIIINIFNFVFP